MQFGSAISLPHVQFGATMTLENNNRRLLIDIWFRFFFFFSLDFDFNRNVRINDTSVCRKF